MSAPIIFLPVIPVQHHQEPAHEPAAVVQAGTPEAPANTRAEHDRRARLNVWGFEQAERHAEMLKQAEFAAAAAELRAAGNTKSGEDNDKHNFRTHAAERKYLQDVISAAERYGVLAHGWKQALATLPPVITSAVRAEGKANW